MLGPIETLDSLEEIMPLLRAGDLPVADLAPGRATQFFGLRAEAALVAVIGLERCGGDGLLRSLAVAPAQRGRGLARRLVAHVEGIARAQGVARLFLLTTSAAPFFARLGYLPASRSAAPAAIRATPQFAGLCPADSAFLCKLLRDDAPAAPPG